MKLLDFGWFQGLERDSAGHQTVDSTAVRVLENPIKQVPASGLRLDLGAIDELPALPAKAHQSLGEQHAQERLNGVLNDRELLGELLVNLSSRCCSSRLLKIAKLQ